MKTSLVNTLVKSALCENQYYLQRSSSPLLIFIKLTKPLTFAEKCFITYYIKWS